MQQPHWSLSLRWTNTQWTKSSKCEAQTLRLASNRIKARKKAWICLKLSCSKLSRRSFSRGQSTSSRDRIRIRTPSSQTSSNLSLIASNRETLGRARLLASIHRTFRSDRLRSSSSAPSKRHGPPCSMWRLTKSGPMFWTKTTRST